MRESIITFCISAAFIAGFGLGYTFCWYRRWLREEAEHGDD